MGVEAGSDGKGAPGEPVLPAIAPKAEVAPVAVRRPAPKSIRCVLVLQDTSSANADPARDANREANLRNREAMRTHRELMRQAKARKVRKAEVTHFSGPIEQELVREQRSVFQLA